MNRLYAIGDIHGCLGKLRRLMVRCEQDADGAPMSFVFIGDYIDRGPESRGVVEYLKELQAQRDVVCLKGNHEALALAAVDESANHAHWLLNGGDTTLRSYGVGTAHELPASHVAWLRSLRLTFDDGSRLFVHAGIDPARPLDAQDEHDLLWIRQPFLSDRRDHGRLIVHGHTPLRTGRPDLQPNRLNIDTAAVFGGPLTAAVFAGDAREPVGFLQVTE
jgi:serine/threonine protein phosphatase 1